MKAWLLLWAIGGVACSAKQESSSNTPVDEAVEADLTEDEVHRIIWHNFRFPDYLWLQDDPLWSEEFAHLSTGWELIATTGSSRQLLYDYFARVPELF